MYEAHFGLARSPFRSGIAQDVFMPERHKAIAANFGVASSTLDSVIVLTGPAGVGKTALTAAALRMTSTRLALAWLPPAPVNGAEVLEALLADFGINAHRVGRVERLQMWRQFLNEMNATETRVFVVAEHADAMDTEVLRALEVITAADPNGGPGANVVLLGGAELNERLKAPVLASLRQRVRLRQTLEPFDVDELRAYLEHCVAEANGSFERIFEPDAVASLQRFSHGVPRALNNLCETALTVAATSGAQRVTADIVAKVAMELLGLEPANEDAADAEAQTHEAAAPNARAAADEFPVLTDAVEETPAADAAPMPVSRNTGDAAHVAMPAPPVAPAARPASAASPAAAPSAARSPSPASPPASAASPPPAAPSERPARASSRTAAVSPTPAAPAAASAARQAPQPPPPQPKVERAPEPQPPAPAASHEPEEVAHQTKTLRALATAKSIDEVSDSMAETLFGDPDLDMLSAALASAGWSEDTETSGDLLEQLARTTVDESATVETPKGAFASFGRQREPVLSLVEEPAAGPRPKTAAKR